jgi:TolB protein
VDLGVALAVFQAPDITTDGVTLAYVSLRGADLSLVLHRLATREERTLTTSSGPLYFSFSRDSSRIAVMRAVAAQPLPYGRLDVLETAAPAATQTLSEELGLAFFWSPDGSRIAYLVLSQDPNTTDPMFLLSGEALYVELRGFEPRTGKSWAITQYPLTRGLVQILPFFDQYLRSITPWSPDGRNLVFTAFANDGVPGVYVVPADGNIKPRYLTPGDSAYWSPK